MGYKVLADKAEMDQMRINYTTYGGSRAGHSGLAPRSASHPQDSHRAARNCETANAAPRSRLREARTARMAVGAHRLPHRRCCTRAMLALNCRLLKLRACARQFKHTPSCSAWGLMNPPSSS